MKSLRSSLLIWAILPLIALSCKQHRGVEDIALTSSENSTATVNEVTSERMLSDEFKEYWYAGKAEITSYRLVQERYGELREGTSVNIFVTEDFLPEVQVKADRFAEKNIPVMKLNNTKKFLTGIYPYSLMTSSFSPVREKKHAIKVTHSMQEWCGQVYIQLNNRENFELISHSYFEGESDQKISLPKTWLENEIWNLIRIAPEELPVGDFNMIPAFEYTRMSHVDIGTYNASATLEQAEGIMHYSINYPGLDRSLSISFESEFPYQIESWEESHSNGLKTTATKIQRIQSAYWGKNRNKDIILRDSLGL